MSTNVNTLFFLRMVLARIGHGGCAIMFMIAVILCFKVADQNGANVYTDIYISGF